MNSACSCSSCGEAGHRPSACPALHEPLKDGFQGGGGGGGGGHSHEDDDEGVCEGVGVCEALTPPPRLHVVTLRGVGVYNPQLSAA